MPHIAPEDNDGRDQVGHDGPGQVTYVANQPYGHKADAEPLARLLSVVLENLRGVDHQPGGSASAFRLDRH